MLCGLFGCSTYHPPGLRADLQAFAPPSIQDSFAIQPSNPFPASVAILRIQGAGYSNYNLNRVGGAVHAGRYTVILTKEVGEDAVLESLRNLPSIGGLTSINRMLLPERIDNDRDIREAAARLQADLVLLYTFDTAFFDQDASVPLSVITLGLSPTRRIAVATTVSALLLDTRSGFIYAAYEITERAETLATTWGSRESADGMRQETETKAFARLAETFIADWPEILRRHPPRRGDQAALAVTPP